MKGSLILSQVSFISFYAAQRRARCRTPEGKKDQSLSSFSTAMKASVGTWTVPRFRIFFFAFLLLLQQFLLAGDIAAVALGQDVLAHGLHRFRAMMRPPMAAWMGTSKSWRGDIILQLFAQAAGPWIGLILMGNKAQGIHAVAV